MSSFLFAGKGRGLAGGGGLGKCHPKESTNFVIKICKTHEENY
jgi:hypothetical protein